MLIEITYNVTDVFMSTTETPVYVEISFEQPSGSAAVWGSITGTLSNQTDLQNALNLKVPYTGATTNVNLGEYELKAGQVTLDTSPTGTAAVGTIRWNDTTGTSETTLKGGNVIIKNGVDLVARVVNKVSPNTTLTKAAYQAVRVSGAQGQRLAIELAQANNDAGSADTIGLVTETIAPNQEGFIMTVGQLEGINTTGSLQGETWVDGDVLYLSPTTAGAITNVKPTGATGHLVIIGYVEYAHVNNGKIYVKVMNGWELDELHNVSIITPTNNQGLFYNSSNSLWENKTISTALGYTPVPTTRNITINGVTYDLSADRTYTISTGISGSGAAGQVTYWDGTSSVSGSNNLFWDNANGRLGIGTNTPSTALHVNGDLTIRGSGATSGSFGFTLLKSSGQSTFSIRNDGFGQIFGNFQIASALPYLQLTPSAWGSSFYLQSGVNIAANAAGDYTDFLTPANRGYAFIQGSTASMVIAPTTSNVSIGTTSDLGTRLGVVGDTILRGSGATSATTALTVQNSSSTNLFRVANDGFVYGGYVNYVGQNSTNPLTFSFVDGAFTSPGAAGRNLGYFNSNTTQTGDQYHFALSGNTITATSGTHVGIYYSRTFAPTSGSGIFSATNIAPIINQVGATGITRGLYVNPTLTAAADFRAIETSAGNVLFGSNFFWDNTNGRLGIGISTPWVSLDVRRSGINELAYFVNTALNAGLIIGTQTNVGYISSVSSLSALGFGINGTTTAIRIFTNSNVSINNNVDLGVRFSVVGDTRLIGSGATSATTALTVQNSSSTNLFTVRNDGRGSLGNSPYDDGIASMLTMGTTLTSGSNRITIGSNQNYQDIQLIKTNATANTQNSWSFGQRFDTYFGNTSGSFQILGGYIDNSGGIGAGTYQWRVPLIANPNGDVLINGASANALTRYIGLGVNAPTALTDIGASTTTRASLRIRSGTAPTSPNDGDIWFDGTDIKMRIGGVTKTFTLV